MKMTNALAEVRMIDLSVAIEHEAPGELEPPRVEYITHAAAGLETMKRVFGCEAGDLVYSIVGTIGKWLIVPDVLSGLRFARIRGWFLESARDLFIQVRW